MKFIKPEVFFVAKTELDELEIQRYLKSIGAEQWGIDNLGQKMDCSPMEKLAEIMGRLCYRSWAAGLNKNVTKIREGNNTYLENIIMTKHGSVFEHGMVSFIFSNISRVLTHELVRHRIGIAISQESLRYVRLDDLSAYEPNCFLEVEWATDMMKEVFEYLEGKQKEMAVRFDLDNMKDFNKKKELTSAMRRLAPIGLATSMGWSCNFRSLRYIIPLRTHESAEEEIRLTFKQVGIIVKTRYPNAFYDMTWVPDQKGPLGKWIVAHEKI